MSPSKMFWQQKRWLEMGVEVLNRHREALDAMYRSGIRLLEQMLPVADANRSTPAPVTRPTPKVSVARGGEELQPRWWPGDRWVQRSDAAVRTSSSRRP